MTDTIATQREITLRFLASPTEVNVSGNIHGGSVMKWMDEAGYICAAGWCGKYCVTVYVSGIRFYKPIHVGDLVEVEARLIYTGNTSMHIAVDVCTRDPKVHELEKTTHCILVFVALDDAGKPTPVPKWRPQTEEERSQEAYALRLMDLRKAIEAEMQSHFSK